MWPYSPAALVRSVALHILSFPRAVMVAKSGLRWTCTAQKRQSVWFGRRNKNRNEGTFGCSVGTKTGTRVLSHVPPERKPERGHIRQNHPLTTKPPSCLLSKKFSLQAAFPFLNSRWASVGLQRKGPEAMANFRACFIRNLGARSFLRFIAICFRGKRGYTTTVGRGVYFFLPCVCLRQYFYWINSGKGARG